MLPTYSGNQVKKSYVTRVFTYRTKDGEQILFCRRQEKKQKTYKMREKTVFALSDTKDVKKLFKGDPIECNGKTFYCLKYEYASVSIYEQMNNSNVIKNNKRVCRNKNNAKNTKKR